MNDLADGVYPGECSECRRRIGGVEWFWFVDAGSAFFTFCRDCGAPDDFDDVTRATAIELTDDRSGEKFARAVEVPASWFDD